MTTQSSIRSGCAKAARWPPRVLGVVVGVASLAVGGFWAVGSEPYGWGLSLVGWTLILAIAPGVVLGWRREELGGCLLIILPIAHFLLTTRTFSIPIGMSEKVATDFGWLVVFSAFPVHVLALLVGILFLLAWGIARVAAKDRGRDEASGQASTLRSADDEGPVIRHGDDGEPALPSDI